NTEEGRPATANPYAGPATHGQAVAKASPQGQQPVGATPAGTTGCGQPARATLVRNAMPASSSR
ncbi:hypothetical protein BHM03_00060842, partial [Ensete ventricosum]